MEGVPGEFAAVSIRKSGSEISPENLPALRLRRRSALPHDGGLQPQAEAAAARAAPKDALQALGTHLAKGSWLGTRSGLKRVPLHLAAAP